MQRNLLVLLTLITLLWTSCSPAKYCAKHFPPRVDTLTRIDTVWTERPVTITLLPDSVDLFIPQVEIDRSKGKPTVKVKRSKQAIIKLTIDSTGIKAEALCAQKDSIIKVRESTIKKLEQVSIIQEIPVTKYPWYHKITLYWTLLSLPVFAYWLLRQAQK